MRWLLCICIFFSVNAHAQTELSEEDRAILDSLLLHDDFLLLLKDLKKGKSYFQAAVSGGNSYFSIRNRRLNTTQQDNKFVLTPSLSYFHKSGLGVSGSAFLISHNNRSDFYQYSGTASWSMLRSKVIESTVSYTRFFRKKGYEFITTPLENELYGKINLVKPWVQPGLSMAYSDGDYTTYHRVDTFINGIRRVFMDTVRTSVNDFSVGAYVQHYFEFYRLFHKKDGIGVTPQLILNAAVSNFEIRHQNRYITWLQTRDPERFKNAGTLEDEGKFEFRSIGFSVDANYSIGKLGVAPQFYIDYYLPETTDKRTSIIVSLELSLNF